MSSELYTRLIEDFCAMHKIDVKHVLAGGSVGMGGVDLSLLYHGEAYAPLVLLFCDFGPVPKDKQLQVYRTLLEMNLNSYSGQGENFALAPGGHVVYTNNYLLEALDAQSLSAHMGLAAVNANRWRSGEFFSNTVATAEREKFAAQFAQQGD